MKRLSVVFIILFLLLASCSGKFKNIAIGKSFAVVVPRKVAIHREPSLKSKKFHLEEALEFVVEDVLCEGGDYTVGCVMLAIDFPEVFFYKVKFESGKEGYINGKYFLPELSYYITSEERTAVRGTTPKEYAAKVRKEMEDIEKEAKARFEREKAELIELERMRREAIEAAPWPDETKQIVLDKNIQIGMTKEQVLMSWGPPEKVVDIETVQGNRQQWFYKYTTLFFEDGKLVRSERTLERP